MSKNIPIIVLGPSGAGKSTLVGQLSGDPSVTIAQTVTTRPQRVNVADTDRRFVSDVEFDELESQGLFQILVPFAGHRYGFLAPQDPTSKLIIIYKVQGLSILADLYEDFRVVAVEAPIEVLKQRLAVRGTPERFHESMLLKEMAMGRTAADLVIDMTKPLDECVSKLKLFINKNN